MTLSRIRVALVVLPLAIGCAHAVYDEPNNEDSSQTGELPASAAGAKNVNSLPDKDKPSASAGSTGSSGAPGSFGGDENEGDAAGAASAAGSTSSAGSPAGGSPGTAGAPATSGGAASAGSSSGGASAGAASGGSPGSGGTTASAGAPSAGAPSAGSSGTSCSDIPTWKLTTYGEGAKVQASGKIYKCKAYPYTGWCGTSAAYAPVTGYAWMDAWDLVGPC